MCLDPLECIRINVTVPLSGVTITKFSFDEVERKLFQVKGISQEYLIFILANFNYIRHLIYYSSIKSNYQNSPRYKSSKPVIINVARDIRLCNNYPNIGTLLLPIFDRKISIYCD